MADIKGLTYQLCANNQLLENALTSTFRFQNKYFPRSMCLTASGETIYLIYVANYFDKNRDRNCFSAQTFVSFLDKIDEIYDVSWTRRIFGIPKPFKVVIKFKQRRISARMPNIFVCFSMDVWFKFTCCCHSRWIFLRVSVENANVKRLEVNYQHWSVEIQNIYAINVSSDLTNNKNLFIAFLTRRRAFGNRLHSIKRI